MESNFRKAGCHFTEHCVAVFDAGCVKFPPLRYVRTVKQHPFIVMPLCGPAIIFGHFGYAFTAHQTPSELMLAGTLASVVGHIVLLAHGEHLSIRPSHKASRPLKIVLAMQAGAREVTRRTMGWIDKSAKPRVWAFAIVAVNGACYIMDGFQHAGNPNSVNQMVMGGIGMGISACFAAAELIQNKPVANFLGKTAPILTLFSLGSAWSLAVGTQNLFLYISAIFATIASGTGFFAHWGKQPVSAVTRALLPSFPRTKPVILPVPVFH